MMKVRIGHMLAVGAIALAGVPLAVSLSQNPAVAGIADVTVPYACAFPAGSVPVGVRVVAVFPDAGTAAVPMAPTGASVTAVVPQAALADPIVSEAAAVTATVGLAMSLTQNGAAVQAPWTGLAVPSTAVSRDGDLVLKATGAVPQVTPPTAGAATFNAGDLTLTLTPLKADGTATTPATVVITCKPAAGATTLVATIPVAEAPKPPPAPGTPAECGKIEVDPPSPGETGCMYMTGFVNVSKLKGAAALNDPAFRAPALTNAIVHPPAQLDGKLQIRVDVKFVDPIRAKSTFLAFGFMPTTATMEMTQVGMGIAKYSIAAKTMTTQLEMAIRVHDVTVNGTPLNVGGDCRSKNAQVVLTGSNAAGYGSPLDGGPLTGSLEIPTFSGCGVGEDLSPIFNASISGPDNYIKVVQGPICVPPGLDACPPAIPPLTREPTPSP